MAKRGRNKNRTKERKEEQRKRRIAELKETPKVKPRELSAAQLEAVVRMTPMRLADAARHYFHMGGVTKPFSVSALAEHWSCSESLVRSLIKSGKLKSFSIGGKLIRISAEEVEKWETSQNLSGTGAFLPPHSPSMDSESAVHLVRLTKLQRGQGLPSFRANSKPLRQQGL